MQVGSENGAASLGLHAGAIGAGRSADFFTLDLDHPLLRGAADDAILDAYLFGCGNEPVDQVWVGGIERGGVKRAT
jgi:formimidoylglutamate deiminase